MRINLEWRYGEECSHGQLSKENIESVSKTHNWKWLFQTGLFGEFILGSGKYLQHEWVRAHDFLKGWGCAALHWRYVILFHYTFLGEVALILVSSYLIMWRHFGLDQSEASTEVIPDLPSQDVTDKRYDSAFFRPSLPCLVPRRGGLVLRLDSRLSV